MSIIILYNFKLIIINYVFVKFKIFEIIEIKLIILVLVDCVVLFPQVPANLESHPLQVVLTSEDK